VAAERAQREQTQRQGLNKKTRQPVTMVTAKINSIPTPPTTKEDIEQACIAENDSQFWQSELTDVMGFSAELPAGEDILASTFDYSQVTHHGLQKVIEFLRMPDAVARAGPIDPHIPVQEHIDGWNKQNSLRSLIHQPQSICPTSGHDKY
jgi:hypothetical protein